MLFAVICEDKPDHAARRAELRPAHLDYLAGVRDVIVTAGPMLADDGETSVGSLLIVDVADRGAAEKFAADDPYATGGLFANVTVRLWRQVIPAATA